MIRNFPILFRFVFSGWIALFFSSCKTEDIDPLVSVEIDSIRNFRISEAGGKAFLVARLNGKSTKDVKINLGFGGTAKQGTDYNVSGSEINIKSGSVSGSLVLSSIQNNLIEGDKSIVISIKSIENATSFSAVFDTLLISDDDLDTDNDGLNDALDECPLDSGAIENNGCPPGFGLIFNEILYDPSNVALDGDANGDGVYDQVQDEFIEFFNNSSTPKNITGFGIYDSIISTGITSLRYTFPAGTIVPPKKALLVFGGGTPSGTFGGATVLICGGPGLDLKNSGRAIYLKDNTGIKLLEFNTDALSDNPNESYTRSPDVSGSFIQHADAFPGKLFSPGTKINGSAF